MTSNRSHLSICLARWLKLHQNSNISQVAGLPRRWPCSADRALFDDSESLTSVRHLAADFKRHGETHWIDKFLKKPEENFLVWTNFKILITNSVSRRNSKNRESIKLFWKSRNWSENHFGNSGGRRISQFWLQIRNQRKILRCLANLALLAKRQYSKLILARLSD